jgi:hypothetical protein
LKITTQKIEINCLKQPPRGIVIVTGALLFREWRPGDPLWTGLDGRVLLNGPLTAFFAFRQCSGAAIRAAMDWALQQARAKRGVVSGVATVGRLTQKLATERNALVAQLAHKIVVAHASPAGSLAAQLGQWRLDGRQVEPL